MINLKYCLFVVFIILFSCKKENDSNIESYKIKSYARYNSDSSLRYSRLAFYENENLIKIGFNTNDSSFEYINLTNDSMYYSYLEGASTINAQIITNESRIDSLYSMIKYIFPFENEVINTSRFFIKNNYLDSVIHFNNSTDLDAVYSGVKSVKFIENDFQEFIEFELDRNKIITYESIVKIEYFNETNELNKRNFNLLNLSRWTGLLKGFPNDSNLEFYFMFRYNLYLYGLSGNKLIKSIEYQTGDKIYFEFQFDSKGRVLKINTYYNGELESFDNFEYY